MTKTQQNGIKSLRGAKATWQSAMYRHHEAQSAVVILYKRSRRYIGTMCLAMTILISSFSLTSAQDKSYTLRDCLQLVVSHSEVLADQQEQVLQAEERYRQAVGALFPSLTGSWTYTLQHATNVSDATAQSTVKLTATQPLFRGFRMVNAIKQNQLLITAQQDAARWAQLQLYADVAQAFYLLQYLRRDRQLLLELQSLYDKRLDELRGRVRIGRSRKTEVLNLEVSSSVLKTQLVQSGLQIRNAESLLEFLTGIGPDAVLIEDSADKPLRDMADYRVRIETRPDVLAARHKIESAEAAVRVANGSQWMPSLDLAANYYLERPAPYDKSDWDAQLLLSLPNFIGYTAQSKTDEAVSVKRQAELSLARLSRQADQNIEDYCSNLAAEQEQIVLLRQALKSAEANVSANVLDYRYGMNTNLDVLTAMNTFVDTKRSLNKMQYTYKTDFVRLESAAGILPEVSQ